MYIYIYICICGVESKNDFLASSPIKRALRMCYSEPLYEERKKQLNSTTNVSISEEIETFVVESSCFFLFSYMYMYVCVCVCVYVYMYMYVCIYMCIYVCDYMYIYTC